jgi:hypothetical protein
VTLHWQRSSLCDSSACIEIAHADGQTFLRDSEGRILHATDKEWDVFVAAVRAGEFDEATMDG